MATTGRNVMWAALVGASVCSGRQAVAADPLTLVLHIDNYASVSPGDLAEAEREATLIYAAAGITTIWMNPGETADSSAPGRHLVVLLLDRAMSQNLIDAQQDADDVLGQALRVTGRAYIFVPRVADVAQRVECKFHIALGRVLAHEIGHLVLPSYSHSRDGIMRAMVDLSKWPQRFSRDQVDTIHRTVAADLAGVSEVEVKSAEPGRTRGIK